MMLADAAQTADGKLYILGGGWSVIGQRSAPVSIALLIEIPWDQIDTRHQWTLELLGSDGDPVKTRDPEGFQQPIRFGGELDVGRPAGLTPGIPIGVPMTISLGPMPLAPGSRYAWALTVDGERREDWQLPFTVRAETPADGPQSGE